MLKFYEDYTVDSEHVTPARTIGPEDVRQFADVTGDHHRLHLDAEFARGTMFGEPIGHGLLGLSLVNGLAYGSIIDPDYVMAFLGLEWKFVRPIRMGATVHAIVHIAERRPTSHPDRGIVREAIRLVDAHGDPLQTGEFTFLVRRRPAL